MITSSLVSVIVPAYNAENFICRTLDSILSQTYKNIEVLVVDDGSEDRTAAIVEYFAQQDSRVSLFKQTNTGVAAARNLAIENSRGKYIAPIDADDLWYPQKIEKQVKCLNSSDEYVGLVYAWSVGINEEDEIISDCNYENRLAWGSFEGKVYPALIYNNFIGNASVPLIRRLCFDEIGGYNCTLKAQNAQGCEDWDLYLRIAEYYEFRLVKDFLVGYRQVNGSMSINYKSMGKSYHLIMKESYIKHPEIPKYLYKISGSQFNIYLAFKSAACADNLHTLIILCQAISLDYSLLLNFWIYKSLLAFIFKIIVQPVSPAISANNAVKTQFTRKLKSKKHRLTQPEQLMDVSSIEKNIQPKTAKNISEKIRLHRRLKILQLCHEFEYRIKKENHITIY